MGVTELSAPQARCECEAIINHQSTFTKFEPGAPPIQQYRPFDASPENRFSPKMARMKFEQGLGLPIRPLAQPDGWRQR
jgi:hypothetical protein